VDRSGGQERGGDEITMLEALEGLSNAEAIARYLALARVENARPAASVRGADPFSVSLDWSAAVGKFAPSTAAHLCKWRGYSLGFVEWLKSQELVAAIGDGIAFPVRNEAGDLLSAHVRPKSGKWFYMPKGRGVHPLIIGNILTATKVMLFESQWDAFAVMEAARWHEFAPVGWAIVCTRGAGNGKFASRAAGAVYAWPQNDEEKDGKRAGETWFSEVLAVSPGPVYRVATPPEFKDANDWTRARPVDPWAAIEGAAFTESPAKRPVPVKAEESPAETTRPPYDPAKILEELDLYWLNGSSNYFLRRADGDRLKFLSMGPAEIRRKLRVRGVRQKPDPEAGEFISPLDSVLDAATEGRAVDYAINLGGTPAGVYDMPGGRILVRESPRLITPQQGSCGTILDFLVSLLGNLQTDYFLAWLKIAFEAVRKGEKRPGQALIIIGPSDCGKSRIQHQIITPMIGGRSADPKSYFFGRTDFNSEMIGAEHLLIEEIPSSTAYEDRIFFGERIKEATVNDTARLHGKMRDAVMVCPFWRLSITLNNEPDKLRALPPMTPDVSEKLIILEAKSAPDFWKRFDDAADPRHAFRAAFTQELPALAYLLASQPVPASLVGKRYGVKSFIPPELAESLFESEPEFSLLMLADKVLWENQTTPETWRGDAEDLKHALTDEGSVVRSSAAGLCKNLQFLGTLLAKLSKAFPHRVEKIKRTGTERGWLFYPPRQS